MGCDVITREQGDYYYLFQFTHPVWGATGYRCLLPTDAKVSIHAPRVGCDEDELED